MKMTTQSDDKKTDGLNINARVFVPSFGTQPSTTTAPQPWATPSGNHISNAGRYVNGVYYPSGSNAPQGQGQPTGPVGAPTYLDDYECDPEAYGDADGGYGYYDENGNFVEVEDEAGSDQGDDNGMDSDEEAWMMEQIMKGEDEYDRMHGIVRDDKGNIVAVNPGTNVEGNQNANKSGQPSAFGAVNQATAQEFARRCVEEESDSSEPEPEFE